MRLFLLLALLCSGLICFSQSVTPAGPLNLCSGTNTTLTVSSPPAGATFQWIKTTPAITNIPGATANTYIVNAPGSYSCIIVTPGPPDTLNTVVINAASTPVAGFNFSPNNICSNTPILFTSTSTGTGLSYAWNFNDPNSGSLNTSTSANPVHTFIGIPGNTVQSFNVQLIITSNNGCKDTIIRTVTTSQIPDPTFLNYTIYNGKRYFKLCTNTSTAVFTFINNSSTAATNTNYQIIWGDATPDYNSATFNTPLTHTYPVGTTTALFIVTGANGCKDTIPYYIFLGTNPAVGLGNPGNTAICTNSSLTFPISSTGLNSPGTIYTITFNDGSAPITYTHPAPADITHQFPITSCGTTSGTYQNSFSATIQAANPCASSTASVVPIYVSQKTPPTFSIVPGDTICINTTASISNTTGNNYEIDNGSGACTQGKWVWSVTPSTGWTISSGSLGNTNGFTDPGFWLTGSTNLNLNFNTIGTYTIKLLTGNTVCGIDSVIKTICVNPLPIAAYSIDQNLGCSPLTVNTNNTSNPPFCGQNKYAWTVTYVATAGCTPAVSNYIFLNGTNANSLNPQFQFINPGVYTIGLMVISPANACSSAVVTRVVTVKSKPITAINPLAAVCENTNLNPTASASCYTTAATYLWTFPGGTPATSSTLNPGSVLFNTTGSINISLAVTNECGTTTAVQAININPKPVLSIPGNSIYCPGNSAGPLSFSSSVSSTSFSWTNSNTSIGLATNGTSNPIPAFTVVNTGTLPISGTINVTGTASGCSATSSFTITVNPKPAAPVASPVSYCQNATAVPLTATATGGNTLLWYTTASGGTGVTTAPTPSTTVVGPQTFYVSQINTTTNCESIRTLINVTINGNPVIVSSTATNPTTCGGNNGTITLTGLSPFTIYAVQYIKNGSTINININTNSAGNVIITGLSAGNYSNITVTLNGCISAAAGPFTLSDPTQPATPSANVNSPVCSGTTLSFTATSATPGVSFSWSGPNSFSSTLANPTILNSTVVNSGNYFVTASLAGCTSAPVSVSVVVNQKPATPTLSSNSPLCSGNNLILNANSTFIGGNWAWTGPNGFTSTQQNPTINNVNTADAGTYTVNLTNPVGNCSSTNAAVAVIVKPTPVIANIVVVNPSVCSGNGTLTIQGLTPSTSYIVNYIKNTIPVGPLTLVSNASGEIILNVTAGTYTNITVTLNGCISNTMAGPYDLTNPNPPATPVIVPSADLCAGQTLTLSASNTSTGIASYNWTGPSGFINSQPSFTINNSTVANAGTYSVTVTIAGCTSPVATTIVVINPTPAIPTINNNSPVCSGNNINLTGSSSFAGAFNWQWTGPNGFTSNVQNPVINNATNVNAGNYNLTVVAQTGNCPSNNAVSLVVVNNTPLLTSATPANPTLCATTTGSISISTLLPNTTYQVNYTLGSTPVNVSIASDASGILTIPNLAAGIYSNITVTLLNCISNALGPITLSDPNPPVAPTAGPNGAICSGNTLSLTASTPSTGVAAYNWTGPNSFSSTLQNPTIANITLAASGTYLVTVQINNCTSPATAVNVLVNQTPALPVINSNTPVCTDSTLNLFAITSFSGGVTWQWTGPNSFTSTQNNPSIPNITTAANGIYTVVATSISGSCPSIAATHNVSLIATPVITSLTSFNPSSCSSNTGSISLNGLTPNAVYTVNYLFNTNPVTTTITANGLGSVIINNLLAGTYSNIYVTGNGCKSASAATVILTDPNPPATPVAGSNTPICSGNNISLNATSSYVGALTYSWTGPAGFNSNLQNPGISAASSVNAGWYFVSVTLNNCQSLKDSVLMVINPLAATPNVNGLIQYCIGTVSTALTASVLPGHTLNWYNVANGGTALPAAPVPSTSVAGTFSFFVSQTTPLGCEGSRAAIDIVIHPDARAVFVPTDTTKCPPFNITPAIIGLQSFPQNNGTYNWYANGTLIGTGTTFPGYIIVNANDSVKIKLETISLFGCKTDSMSHMFYTFKIPTPSFAKSDTGGCGPMTISFTNTTADISLYNYLWDFGNGQTSTAVQPTPVIFTTNPNFGDTVYVIKLKVFSVCDTLIYSDSVRIKSRPKALFTPSRTTGCSPMQVVFTNNSLGLNNTYYWDFGDGTTIVTTSAASQNHVYTTGIVDTFYVKLLVVNECGRDSITYDIIASPNNIRLNYSVNGTQQAGCAPHVVAFINNTFGATSFQWDFGDGNILSTTLGIDTIYHTYLTPGTFTVSMKAINSCTDTIAYKTINVFPKPVASFTANPFTICIGQSVQFNNNSTDATSYQWQFGDGNTSTLVAPQHTYSLANTYSVQLIAYRTNPGGTVCVDTTINLVTVGNTLPGTISVSATSSPCAPFTVTFVNRDRPSSSVLWNFGDGNTATGDSVVHTYQTSGSFLATAIVTAPGGCIYNSNQLINVNGPSGSLAYNAGYACYPDPVRFDATAINTNNYQWDFGDGITQTTSTGTVFHNYVNPGVYVPSVNLQNTGGCNYPIRGLDTVKIDKLDAGFNWNNQYNCGSTTVTFTDTSYIYFGTAQTTWDFGDGGTATGAVVTHTYTSGTNYSVTMVVTGNSGCTKTIITNVPVIVHDIPNTSITADLVRCANESVVFSSNISSVDPINFIRWNISNGATGTGATFNYTFTNAGVYTVQLITATTFGCADTATHNIQINPVPVMTASSPATICLGNSAQLNATGAPAYTWTPTNGLSCTTCPNPVATPTATTPYVVTGTNTFGCNTSINVAVTVIQPIDINVTPDDSICIGQSINLLAVGATNYTWSPASGLNFTNISNPVATPNVTTIYRVVGYDGFNCFTDTALVIVGVGQYPTVNLGPDKTLATGTQLPLNYTVTNGPLSQWNWLPSANLSCDDCALPIATVRNDITYILEGSTAYGCSARDTIKIKTFCKDAQVFIPNAFTPDGDGVNDYLTVRGTGIASVKSFRIFNRWGELIFERNNFNPNNDFYGWDGKTKGKTNQPDVFVYTAEVICDNGTPFTYKGNTSIIK